MNEIDTLVVPSHGITDRSNFTELAGGRLSDLQFGVIGSPDFVLETFERK